jgi:hypothetical protein
MTFHYAKFNFNDAQYKDATRQHRNVERDRRHAHRRNQFLLSFIRSLRPATIALLHAMPPPTRALLCQLALMIAEAGPFGLVRSAMAKLGQKGRFDEGQQ